MSANERAATASGIPPAGPLGPDIAAPFPVEHSRTTPHGLRLDIQALRGWAIISVLWHHARLPGLPGGFLGVDIFFVISGYLMTGIIARELEERRFSFLGFYARRARRLLPAAYATLTVTAMLAPFLLDSHEYADFVVQLAGTFAFVANYVLWHQVDYFNTGAALKPLLHTWSLAVEEQYYLVLPLMLFLCPARLRLAFGALLTIGSALFCVWLLQHGPSAAFYFLPSRAWELGIGSVAALLVRRGTLAPRPMVAIRAACAILLVVVPMLVTERGHPGLPALVICLATAVLMVPGAGLRPSPLLSPITMIGDRSYSLYLVHWPVFAFANNIVIGPVPLWANLLLLAPCLIWMEAQYRLCEQPLRTIRLDARAIAILVAIPLIVAGASAVWSRQFLPAPDPAQMESYGLNRACDYKGDYTALPACATGAHPHILVWGDSFAMHLVEGIRSTAPDGMIQATRTVCGPFLRIAPVNGVLMTRQWGGRCIAFNDQVLAKLPGWRDVDTVVLSSPLDQYLPGEAGWQALVAGPAGETLVPASAAALERGLVRTVAAIRALGKRVIMVAPPPSVGVDEVRCVRRRGEGRVTISARPDCTFTVAGYHAAKRPVLAVLDDIQRRGIAPVMRMDGLLCRAGICRVAVDGVPLYRDAGHLNAVGSRWIGERMQWGTMLRAQAR